MEPTTATDLAGSAAVHDPSMLGLFLQAGPIVKLVMLSLIFASFWTWAIMIEKFMTFRTLKSYAAQFEKAFWNSEALDNFYNSVRKRASHPMSEMFLSGMEEWYRSRPGGSGSIPYERKLAIRDRILTVMSVARNRELEKLEKNLTFLATVGSTAPFVGLFGTVWGIMHSFQSIAMSKNTSLAVVAPGIAEALLATAIGLVAAIPAVIAYNKFSAALAKYAGRLEDFAEEFSALLSRQLEA